MTKTSPEQEPQQNLTAQVMTQARAAYDTLRELLKQGRSSMYEKEEDTPEGVALAAAIGTFVADHTEALGDIGDVERTPELQAAADAWLGKRIQRKLESAMFSEILKQKEAELTALLAGRTIKATCLKKYGFAIGDRYGVRGAPDGPKEVTAPFYAVEPAQGTIWLGTPDEHYQVHLWDVMDNTQPASVIEVL